MSVAKHNEVEMIESLDAGLVVESEEARVYDVRQHEETWQHALRNNPKSLTWCAYALFTVIMFGYDGLSSSICIAVEAFREDYGVKYGSVYVVPARWQLAFIGATLVGLILGGLGTAYLVKRFGRKICLWVAYLLCVAGAFLQWFSRGSLGMFFAGKLVTGFPMGAIITIVPTYVSEIAPLALRGAVIGAVNWSLCLGQLLAFAVLRQTGTIVGSNSYRILFAVQWGFAGVALIFIPFFPDSSYQLVALGKIDKARKNIARLHGPGFDTEGYLASIVAGLASEVNEEKASFVECFKGTNLKRTLTASGIFFVQHSAGVGWVVGYMAYFMVLGGLPSVKAFDTSVGLIGIMVVGNMCGWFIVEKFGRRNTCIYGVAVLAFTLLMIGIMAVIPVSGAIWAQVAFMAVWAFTYQATIGTASWPIVAEVPTSSLRGHTQAISTASSGLVAAAWQFVLPYMVNPDQGNMGGKVAFVYSGILFLAFPVVYLYIPETKGRTFVEIDTMFKMGIKPRFFHKTKLTLLADDKASNAEVPAL